MRKRMAYAALLLLVLCAGAPLAAAECPSAAQLGSSAASLSPSEEPAQPELAEELGLGPLGPAVEMLPPSPTCKFIACQLTPTGGCTCDGFVCNGRFICGISVYP